MGGKNNIGGTLKLPKLNNMLVISEPMAERVMGMKEEQLMLMLGGLDISENQKKAAWERVREVKDKIKAARMITEEDFSQKLKDYEFYIVPDDKWEKLKVEKNLIPEIIKWGQGEKNQKKNKYILTYNLYSRLYNNKACIEAENKMQGSQEQKEKILTFKEGTYESPSFSEYGIEKNKEEIDRIAEQMKNMFGKEGLENRGREFQDMYKNVQTLQTWFKEHGNFENITREDKQALRNAYAQTQESCQAYIRKHNPWTKIGKDRQNAATELMEFIGAQGIAIDGYFALQENTREIILKNEERINEFLKLANTLKEGLKTGSAEEKKACQEAIDAQKTLYIMSTKKALSPENQKEAVGWMKKLIAYDEIKRYVDRENWQKQLKNKNHTPQGLRQFLQEESVLREQARGQKQLEKQEKKVSVKDNGQICQKL